MEGLVLFVGWLVFAVFSIMLHVKLGNPSRYSWLELFIVLWIGIFYAEKV